MPHRVARRVEAADGDERREPGLPRGRHLFRGGGQGTGANEITTAGVFGKPKLGRIFAGKSASGRFFADHLFASCEKAGRGDDPSYCENVLVGPTGASANDRIVMDEVIETTREGVRADGTRKRPNLTFVNFPQIDVSGHGSGVGPGYDAAINSADTEIGRFVQNQKQLGLWKRTTMIVLSDHSMDTTPQKTSLTQCYRAAGIDSDDFVIVQNGSAALVYLADRTDPGRFRLLKRLRAASALWYRGVGDLGGMMGLSGTNAGRPYRPPCPAGFRPAAMGRSRLRRACGRGLSRLRRSADRDR